MTTERELLELAAKAAGIRYDEVSNDGLLTRHAEYGDDGYSWSCWHPGRNSADGAELEAALGLCVIWRTDGVEIIAPDTRWEDEHPVEKYADHGGNKQNARMWATLRAAAEIQLRESK